MASESGFQNQNSDISVEVIAGEEYYISVDGVGEQTGEVEFYHYFEEAVPPSNDNFDDSILVDLSTGSAFVNYDTSFSTGEASEPLHGVGLEPIESIWYSVTTSNSGYLEVLTYQNTFDSAIAVYEGDSLSGLSLIVAQNDTYEFESDYLGFLAEADKTYHVAIDGTASEEGQGILDFYFNEKSGSDTFGEFTLEQSWYSILCNTLMGTSGQDGEPLHGADPGDTNSMWWTWVAPASGIVTISDIDSDPGLIIAAYSGDAIEALNEIDSAAYSTSPDGSGIKASIAFSVVEGETVHVALDGTGSNEIEFVASLSFETN